MVHHLLGPMADSLRCPVAYLTREDALTGNRLERLKVRVASEEVPAVKKHASVFATGQAHDLPGARDVRQQGMWFEFQVDLAADIGCLMAEVGETLCDELGREVVVASPHCNGIDELDTHFRGHAETVFNAGGLAPAKCIRGSEPTEDGIENEHRDALAPGATRGVSEFHPFFTEEHRLPG